MDTLERLEDSIRRFVEAYGRLREERDHLSGELLLVGAELEQARETVASLRGTLDRLPDGDDRSGDLDARKDELRESVRRIIGKIDSYAGSGTADAVDGDGSGTGHALPANYL